MTETRINPCTASLENSPLCQLSCLAQTSFMVVTMTFRGGFLQPANGKVHPLVCIALLYVCVVKFLASRMVVVMVLFQSNKKLHK